MLIYHGGNLIGGFAAFTDEGVRRPQAQRLVPLVEVDLTDGGDQLLSGEVTIEVHTDAEVRRSALAYPPGSPQNPPTENDLHRKIADCLAGTPVAAPDISWDCAADLLRSHLPQPGASPINPQ